MRACALATLVLLVFAACGIGLSEEEWEIGYLEYGVGLAPVFGSDFAEYEEYVVVTLSFQYGAGEVLAATESASPGEIAGSEEEGAWRVTARSELREAVAAAFLEKLMGSSMWIRSRSKSLLLDPARPSVFYAAIAELSRLGWEPFAGGDSIGTIAEDWGGTGMWFKRRVR